MPQLPSGRHVAMAADPVVEKFSQPIEFGFAFEYQLKVRNPQDIYPLINTVYFRPGADNPGLPGEPYLSGLMLSDIGQPACDWPEEDQRWFLAWLQEPTAQHWLQQTFDTLAGLVKKNQVPLPQSLHGILDSDD